MKYRNAVWVILYLQLDRRTAAASEKRVVRLNHPRGIEDFAHIAPGVSNECKPLMFVGTRNTESDPERTRFGMCVNRAADGPF